MPAQGQQQPGGQPHEADDLAGEVDGVEFVAHGSTINSYFAPGKASGRFRKKRRFSQ